MGLEWWQRVMAATRRSKQVCKTSLMLMQTLVKLTTVQVDGCCITNCQLNFREIFQNVVLMCSNEDSLVHYFGAF